MKLYQFLRTLNELVKKNPKLLDYEVITSIDDEGNGFNGIHFNPTIGIFNSKENSFYSTAEAKNKKPNAICIN